MSDSIEIPEDFPGLDELKLEEIATAMREAIEVKDRKYRLRTYKSCFLGNEACSWLVSAGHAEDLTKAQMLGNILLQAGFFHHVVRDHEFKNEGLFYRFVADYEHGKVAREDSGAAISWYSLIAGEFKEAGEQSMLPRIPDYSEELSSMDVHDSWGVEPLDEHNAKLLDNVHPREWNNPEAEDRYTMLAIGAGAGGLVTAAGSAGVGAKAGIIEEHLLGGDCLNFGCVPSKALLSAAKVAATVRGAAKTCVGIEGISAEQLADKVTVDFPAVMERLRKMRAHISKHDAASRFADDLGVDVHFGRAKFTSENTVEVGGKTLTFKKCCIATGGRPAIPDIPGLKEAPYLTNLSVFNLTQLPKRFGVIGTGVIGMEMAQAFQRFGSEVTLFSRNDRVLPKEDPDAAEIVKQSLERDGVKFHYHTKYKQVSHSSETGPNGFPEITLELEDGSKHVFDTLLIATGRKPNVDDLNLEAAGVKYDLGKGVIVDDKLQTSNPNIYAVGDVATKYQFTHAADFMARLVIRNALFFGRGSFSSLLIPWATYTEPEIAHVGLYEADLKAQDIPYQTFTRYFKDVDRCIVEGKTEGFVRVHVKDGSDKILGATIVGETAGDMISEITMAMQNDIGLGTIANVIHPYPTAAEAIRQVGDAYNRTRMTPSVKKVFRGLMQLQS